MPSLNQALQVYQELADWHERHGPPHVRDRFLILAADAAQTVGREDEADRLRQRLLQLNAHHLLRPFASFAEALRSPDVRNYVLDLRKNYPPEVAEEMRHEVRSDEVQAEEQSKITEDDIETSAPQQHPGEPNPVVVYWDDQAKPVAESIPKQKRAAPAKQAPATPRSPTTPVPGKLAQLAAARREVFSLRPEPSHTKNEVPSPPPEDEEPGHTAWVSGALFGFLMMLGGGLVIYTLVWPFVP